MSDIHKRIRQAIELSRDQRQPCEQVIYLGRSEFYDLLLSMRGWTPVHISYVDDVRRVRYYDVEVIEVCMPKYLRVA